MSKIKELIKESDTVLVFDVDGVLASIEYGEYNHYSLTDEEWNKETTSGINLYTEDLAFTKMKSFINNINKDNIYVVSKSFNENEDKFKRLFLINNYGIKEDNIYFVREDSDKKNKLNVIKDKYPNLDNKKIVMIDDSVSVLTDIMNNTNYSTIHISSFLDI